MSAMVTDDNIWGMGYGVTVSVVVLGVWPSRARLHRVLS